MLRYQHLVKLLTLYWITGWSHDPPTYRRAACTPRWHRTHTVPKFGLQKQLHYKRMPLHSTTLHSYPDMNYLLATKDPLSQEEVTESQTIVAARIHVERAIQRIKDF